MATTSTESFLVSAPGKVILFGEHSAVYGKPAIAASLSLRNYLLVTPNGGNNNNHREIKLKFPDIGLSQSWNIDELPWREVKPHIVYKDGLPCATDELVPEIDDTLREYLGDIPSSLHFEACRSFLYLYVNLCDETTGGKSYTVKSALPIGAGLGSSACTSVCLASALALLGGHVGKPTLEVGGKGPRGENKSLEFVDLWSLMGEKCFHGNPSGIDNAVATYGGAVMFQRMNTPSRPSVRTSIRRLPNLNLLLTNTKVPRSTAVLVGKVAQLHSDFSKCSSSILDAMGLLVHDAYELLLKPLLEDEEKENLRKLFDVNHGLLVALGVSHPALEKVRCITSVHDIGSTKLTGAGGGGCAITLLKENLSRQALQEAINEFEKEGFDHFETSLGGKGVGVRWITDTTTPDSPDAKFVEDFFNLATKEHLEKLCQIKSFAGWKFW